MALQHASRPMRVSPADLLRVFLIVALAIALAIGIMLVLTWVLGVGRAGPSYQIVPDPAGQLSF
jgi:hypothetical protein